MFIKASYTRHSGRLHVLEDGPTEAEGARRRGGGAQGEGEERGVDQRTGG
jgi:hypothetical protein